MKVWIECVCLGSAVLVATSALASDHADGPAVAGTPNGDIVDLYAWAPPSTDELVMIQTIVGTFSEDIQYVFHVGRSAAPALMSQPDAWTDVICTFDANARVSCWVGDADYVAGDASSSGGIVSAAGTLKVHTGQHADPFYFYVAGFTQAVSAILAAAPTLSFNAGGCPSIDAQTSVVLVSLLNGMVSGPAVNTYASANVDAIVVELDKSLISGSGEYFAIWASTHDAN